LRKAFPGTLQQYYMLCCSKHEAQINTESDSVNITVKWYQN